MRHISTNIRIKTGYFLRVFTHFYRGFYGFLAYFEQENYSSERTLLFFEICTCVAITFSQNILEKKLWGYFYFVGGLIKRKFIVYYPCIICKELALGPVTWQFLVVLCGLIDCKNNLKLF
jgi:hypothetical protein